MGLSGIVRVKEEIFGSGIEDFVPFSINCARNEHDHLPILPWPEASSDQEAGPFLRLLSREGAKDSSRGFGSVWRILPFLHACLRSPGVRVLAHYGAARPAAGRTGHWALFCSFPDQEVRRMAVQWIGSLSDAELLDYLPQLVQVGGLACWSCNDPTCKPPCRSIL